MKNYTLKKLVKEHMWSAILSGAGDEQTISFPGLDALESFRVYVYQKSREYSVSVDRSLLTVTIRRKDVQVR